MAALSQILSCFLILLSGNLVLSSPFGEFKLNKHFDFEFKPIPFKPIHFVKEKWFPFLGKFGVMHGIEKRDLEDMKPLEEKEVKESTSALENKDVAEYKSGVETKEIPEETHEELVEGQKILEDKMHEDKDVEEDGVVEDRLPAEVHEGPLGVNLFTRSPLARVPMMPSMVGPSWIGQFGPQLGGAGPVYEPPPPHEVIITPPPPKVEPMPGLHTNIARDQLINGYLKEVEREPPTIEDHEEKYPPALNSIEKPLPPPPKLAPPEKEEDNPFIRGSKLALYFGNLLLDIMSRFLGKSFGPVKE